MLMLTFFSHIICHICLSWNPNVDIDVFFIIDSIYPLVPEKPIGSLDRPGEAPAGEEEGAHGEPTKSYRASGDEVFKAFFHIGYYLGDWWYFRLIQIDYIILYINHNWGMIYIYIYMYIYIYIHTHMDFCKDRFGCFWFQCSHFTVDIHQILGSLGSPAVLSAAR